MKEEEERPPYPLGSELNLSLSGFSEALCPEGNPPGAPGPCVDGREWSPGPDGPEPWILPSAAQGRE